MIALSKKVGSVETFLSRDLYVAPPPPPMDTVGVNLYTANQSGKSNWNEILRNPVTGGIVQSSFLSTLGATITKTFELGSAAFQNFTEASVPPFTDVDFNEEMLWDGWRALGTCDILFSVNSGLFAMRLLLYNSAGGVCNIYTNNGALLLSGVDCSSPVVVDVQLANQGGYSLLRIVPTSGSPRLCAFTFSQLQ
jgi:hypothetical protein